MNIYLLGIAGTGMGSFAGLLRAAGHQVSGSDENVYPPMSDKLAEWRIQTFTPYSAGNLEKAKPDMAVVGNVIRADNPEAKAVRRKGVPHMSFPETLEELFLKTRHPVVVAGTHGKTTTTSILAAVLHHAGLDPSLLVGGVPLNFNEGFRLGRGEHFVIEGDEYDTAYFDKGPKFLHYRPRTAIVTGAEFDHADIYRDTPHYESAFEKFYALLPEGGYAAACSTFPNWKRLASFARCRVESYSSNDSFAAGGWSRCSSRAATRRCARSTRRSTRTRSRERPRRSSASPLPSPRCPSRSASTPSGWPRTSPRPARRRVGWKGPTPSWRSWPARRGPATSSSPCRTVGSAGSTASCSGGWRPDE